MQKRLFGFGTLIMIILSGCSSTPEPIPVKEPAKEVKKVCAKKCPQKIYVKYKKSPPKAQYRDIQLQYPKLIYTKATGLNTDTMGEIITKLSNQLEKNNKYKSLKDAYLLISVLESVDKDAQEPSFENLFHDRLVHEMQKKGYQILDQQKELTKNKIFNFALVGSYSKLHRGLLVNVKIVDLTTHLILSSAQVVIPSRELKKL